MERKTSANKKTSHALNLALIFLPGSANSWLFLEREQLISKARAMHLDVVTGQAPAGVIVGLAAGAAAYLVETTLVPRRAWQSSVDLPAARPPVSADAGLSDH